MTLKKFLIMVENDVAGEMVFDDVFERNKKLYDALVDSVRVIEVDENAIIEKDHIWDGQTFRSR
jgi:hypothetical protein